MSNKRPAERLSLTVQYPIGSTRGPKERRVVCVFYGVPPVTAAEVEIMNSHLSSASNAANDTGNVVQPAKELAP